MRSEYFGVAWAVGQTFMKLPVYVMKGARTSLKVSNSRELCKPFLVILMALYCLKHTLIFRI